MGFTGSKPIIEPDKQECGAGRFTGSLVPHVKKTILLCGFIQFLPQIVINNHHIIELFLYIIGSIIESQNLISMEQIGSIKHLIDKKPHNCK